MRGTRSLEKKFFLYLTGIITFIMIFVTVIYVYLEREQARTLIGDQAMATALAVAEIPDVKRAIESEQNVEEMRALIERIRESAGAEYIVVGNQDGIRIAHPNESELGLPMLVGDNEGALIYGNTYMSLADGSLGTAVRGKTPVLNDEGAIIGVVSVGFMIEYIDSVFQQGFIVFILWLSFIFLLGLIASKKLASSIRRDTFGLEPYQIARLYKEREAVFESVNEGLLATDQLGVITLINHTAKEMLMFKEDVIGKPIEQVIPNSEMAHVLKHKEGAGSFETTYKNKRLIIHYHIILEDNGVYGGKVASFQYRSDMHELINALSEIQQYSRDLRAQTHEHTNKLYAISGWLQLGLTQKAVEFIHQETGTQQRDNQWLFEQIKDPTIQAILIGKRSKASEKKIEFVVDAESSAEWIWTKGATAPLVTIIGNIIDNAFDAVSTVESPSVTVFMTDMADELVIEIADNGAGIDQTMVDQLFVQGVSTKEEVGRGYGLSLVQAALEELDGSLEIGMNTPQGTIVSLYIPKRKETLEE
ncbi:LOW QUALITY PROTEIN: sensor kinase CitA, DpiB [Bacillus sp. JCM 19045]|nr:LOW QUALITY PROTEIN: sensor kinase CitA, DpiB [Bacillus sp. JCM 19045]